MTDLEITRLCAQAMGYTSKPLLSLSDIILFVTIPSGHPLLPDHTERYDPLHDDAQAMALVKKFHIGLAWSGYWSAYEQGNGASGSSADLNYSICECVAKMMKEKPG